MITNYSLPPELVYHGLDVVSGSILGMMNENLLAPEVSYQEVPKELSEFDIDAPSWEPSAPETVVAQHTLQAVVTSSDVAPITPKVDIAFDHLDLDAPHLLAIREVFGAKLKMRLNNPLMKWMRDIKKNHTLIGQETTIFCIINHEILSHFASEFWSQDPRLRRLTRDDVSQDVEIATRIKVLSWLYFKKDILSSSHDLAFPELATYVDNLVKSKVISREEAEFIYSPIVDKKVMETLLSRKPFPDKLEIPFSKMKFRVEDLTESSISRFVPVFVGKID
jgi:hypothetical protein